VSLLLLLETPVFPPLALILLFVAYVLLRPSRGGKVVDTDEEGARHSDDEVKGLIDRAIDAKKRQDLLKAGWMYEQGKLWVKAAECYQGAGDGLWAAELFTRGGAHRRAGELYRLNGYALEAGRTLEQGGMLGDAGVNYAVAGDLPRAARLFEQAGRPEQAADLYSRLGMYHQAGKLFEKAHQNGRAADAYERMIETLDRDTLQADVQIARVLEDEGRHDATIRFLEAVGEVMASLRTAIRHGKDDEALRLYRKYREILAGPLLKGASEGKLSATVLADLFERAGDHVPAARMAQLLGQWRRVAELYEQAGKDAKAGKAWEEAGELREAALAYERAGQFDRAAELFEERGEPVRAIHCYRQDENHYAAAQLYERVGEAQNAITAYQGVDASHPRWRVARARLAHLLRDAKREELAIDTLIDLLGSQAPTREDLDDLQTLAEMLEEDNRHGEAAACWFTMAGIDAMREGVDASYARIKALAKSTRQEIPPAFPYARPAEPERPSRPSYPSATPSADSSHGDTAEPLFDAAPPGLAAADQGALPVGVTAAAEAPRGDSAPPAELNEIGDDHGAFDGAGSQLVPKDTLVSFEAFIDGFTDENLPQDSGEGAAPAPAAAGGTGGGRDSEEVDWQPSEAEDDSLSQGVDGPPMWEEDDDWAEPDKGAGGEEIWGMRPEFGVPSEDDLSWTGSLDEGRANAANQPIAGWEESSADGPNDASLSHDGDAFVSGVIATGTFGAEDAPSGSPLASFEVFSIFDKRERFLVEQFLEFREAASGEVVLGQDDDNDGLLLLLHGEMEISKANTPPRTVRAVTLVGEEMLLMGELPEVTVRAKTDCQCWVLSRAAARSLADRDRDVALTLAKALRAHM
jgi:tetratricopeptide (TPR) repeat protein